MSEQEEEILHHSPQSRDSESSASSAESGSDIELESNAATSSEIKDGTASSPASLPELRSRETSDSALLSSDDENVALDADDSPRSVQNLSTSPLPSFPYPATTQSTRELDLMTSPPAVDSPASQHSAYDAATDSASRIDSSSDDAALPQDYDYDASSDEDVYTTSSSTAESNRPSEVTAEEPDHVLKYEPPPAFTIDTNNFDAAQSQQQEQEVSPVTHTTPQHHQEEKTQHQPPARKQPKVRLLSSHLLESAVVCPVKNPLSGNLLVCTRLKGHVVEFDVKLRCAVISVPICSRQVKRKMAALYKDNVALVVSKVVVMAAGIHEQRVHVAALVDFDMSGTNPPRRAIVVWRWGNEATLHSVVKPPSPKFLYEESSLQTANDTLFFSGEDRHGVPLVVVSTGNAWSSINVGPVDCRVTSMAVASKHPVLAVALSNDSIGVWNYEGDNLSLLYNLKTNAAPVELRTTESGDVESKQIADGYYCTHMEWSLPATSGDTSFVLLAVVYMDSVAVFCISAVPTAGTTSMLEHFAAGGLPDGKSNVVTWLNLGPHCSPFLGVLCSHEDGSDRSLCFLSLNLPTGDADNEIRSICATPLSRELSGDQDSMGIVGIDSVGSIVYYCGGRLDAYSPTMSSNESLFDPYFSCMRQPVVSEPSGLDSFGSVSSTSLDDVLFVSTTLHCVDGSPVRRHWLYRTHVAQSSFKDDLSTERSVYTEGLPNVVCELKNESAGPYPDIQPQRLARCRDNGDCALLYAASLGDEVVSENSSMFILLDAAAKDVSPFLYHGNGRDVVFLPKGSDGTTRALLLCNDGASVRLLTRNVVEQNAWEETSVSSPLFSGISSFDEYSEGRRLFVISAGSRIGLVVSGCRVLDGKSFISRGPLMDFEEVQLGGWSNILPNLDVDPVMWLEAGEDVVTVLQLPDDGVSHCCIAIATQRRVIILDVRKLSVLAEASTRLASASLAPIGSHTVAFCSSDSKLHYLCCLEGKFSLGLLATLAHQSNGEDPYSLLAVRPDRILYAATANAARSGFSVPIGTTRPALCLEPLVANALCTAADHAHHTKRLVHVATEKFGRKLKSLAHESGGTGNLGAGVTQAVIEMLASHGFEEAALWLLAGSSALKRKSNPRIVPTWASMASKGRAAQSSDATLHILANGDRYLSEYVKSPDQNMIASLPRDSDPSAKYAMEFAREALNEGSIEGGIKLLDFAGVEPSEKDLLFLSLALELDPFADNIEVLASLCGNENNGVSSSIASLALGMKMRLSDNRATNTFGNQLSHRNAMKRLAPSLQRSRALQRSRPRLIGEKAARLAVAGMDEAPNTDTPPWMNLHDESHHIWNKGPSEEKENLLALDQIEDWLGRSQPTVLGEEGAAATFGRGEKRLADILAKDDDSINGQSDVSSTQELGWVTGVGEGRTDEDNLSAYFRMSEGAEEELDWRSDGLSDLTTFQHKCMLVGKPDSVSLEPTTSSVDEGQPGKVKLLYDVVFEESSDGSRPAGLVIDVLRGGSLDVGMLHEPDHDSRKKCSIEFWYHLPTQETVATDIILVRRSASSPGEDLSSCCVAANRERLLWELVVLPSGELEFKSNSGGSLLSTSKGAEIDSPKALSPYDVSGDAEDATLGRVSWERDGGSGGWNHVCLVLSSRLHSDPTTCTVSIIMDGLRVASGLVSVVAPEFNEEDHSINAALARTALGFCIKPVTGLRITELRVWSCERSDDDCKMMMHEYLREAETKRKLKIKIRTKRKVLSPEESKLKSQGGLLAPPPREGGQALRGRKIRNEIDEKLEDPYFQDMFEAGKIVETNTYGGEPLSTNAVTSHTSISTLRDSGGSASETKLHDPVVHMETEASSTDAGSSSSWSSSLKLSEVVRRSAAAALIRGPPATRHFGGNKGGLVGEPVSSGSEASSGIGAIAICGAEKTVVFSHEKSPPGRTYPIGASGAIISDEMDHNGNEFLCCFLAKEKRMVLFELSSKALVVELQMTTKLNFWRYLPPEAHGHSLVFMIVTPVGGFHWTPLDATPHPTQVWNRGPDLQGKKVILYEEGGSNGESGPGARSAVALLLATVPTSNPVEAWVMPVCGDSRGFCVSNNVLGAALCCPTGVGDGRFLPYAMTATLDLQSNILVEIAEISGGSSHEPIAVGDLVARTKLSLVQLDGIEHAPPSMAIGSLPEVICCSSGNVLVVAVRRKGLVAAYYFTNGSLELIMCEAVGNFVVDAAVSSRGRSDARATVIVLVCDSDNPKDGRVLSALV